MRNKFLGLEGRFGVGVVVFESLFFVVGLLVEMGVVFVVGGFWVFVVFIVVVSVVVVVGVCESLFG